MILPDHKIIDAVESGRLVVDPFDRKLVQPASIDVRLDPRYRVFRTVTMIDPFAQQDLTEPGTMTALLMLNPGQFVLGATFERVTLPNDLVAVEGKSSLGRLGLQVHLTAGFIDPGFDGQVTLELHNVTRSPILLRPRMTIAQLSFHEMTAPCVHPYGEGATGSKYQGQMGPTPSSYWRNPKP